MTYNILLMEHRRFSKEDIMETEKFHLKDRDTSSMWYIFERRNFATSSEMIIHWMSVKFILVFASKENIDFKEY